MNLGIEDGLLKIDLSRVEKVLIRPRILPDTAGTGGKRFDGGATAKLERSQGPRNLPALGCEGGDVLDQAGQGVLVRN